MYFTVCYKGIEGVAAQVRSFGLLSPLKLLFAIFPAVLICSLILGALWLSSSVPDGLLTIIMRMPVARAAPPMAYSSNI